TLHMDAVNANGNSFKSAVQRIGQEWRWWPKAVKLKDNRLKPLESRAFAFKFEIPYKAEEVGFRVRLVTHRMSRENAEFNKLLAVYPLSALVFDKLDWLNLPH
ncbi:MAG: hypothetical protein ACE5G1_02785, partial [bacterium]